MSNGGGSSILFALHRYNTCLFSEFKIKKRPLGQVSQLSKMKITASVFALANGNHIQREINSECPSFDESSACANDCENANLACIIACENDTHCVVLGLNFPT